MTVYATMQDAIHKAILPRLGDQVDRVDVPAVFAAVFAPASRDKDRNPTGWVAVVDDLAFRCAVAQYTVNH